MANPTLLKTPIASGGDKNTIPETTGSTTGLLSQEKGWQQINSLPINAGGIAPSRLDFNGVFNLLSNILFYTQKGWQWEFDETQNYFAGCTVKDTADGKTYVCIADVSASTTHPNADTAHWKLSDLATKDDLANYLPLAGGAMSGVISRNADNSALTLKGGVLGNACANMDLCGKDHPNAKGYFYLEANDGNNSKTLIGNPNGTLTWGGANILTDANGGYLPLSGGAMDNSATIKQGDDSHYIQLLGGTNGQNGGLLILNGATSPNASTEGNFLLRARWSTATLAGYEDGRLTWAGNDLGGASIVAKSLGTNGYIKYASGLTIQWGYVAPSSAMVDNVAVSFPISFLNACVGVYEQSIGTNPDADGAMVWRQINSVTTSGFKFSRMGTMVETGKYWFAIGY